MTLGGIGLLLDITIRNCQPGPTLEVHPRRPEGKIHRWTTLRSTSCLFALILLASCGRVEHGSVPGVIDYHVHMFTPEVVAAIEAQGFEFTEPEYQFADSMESVDDIDFIIKNNPAGKMLVISGGFNFREKRGPGEEIRLVQSENALLSRMVEQNPYALIGFCGLDPLKSYFYDELVRCRDEFRLHGLKLHLPISQVDLNNTVHLRSLEGAFRFLAANRIPVLIHNTSNGSGTAYARLIIRAFLEPNYELTVIFAHAGGGSQLTDFTNEFLSEVGSYLKQQTNGHKIFFELSAIASLRLEEGNTAFDELAENIIKIGPDRFLLGSDFPMRNSEKYASELSARLPLPASILRQISRNDIFDELRSGDR